MSLPVDHVFVSLSLFNIYIITIRSRSHIKHKPMGLTSIWYSDYMYFLFSLTFIFQFYNFSYCPFVKFVPNYIGWCGIYIHDFARNKKFKKLCEVKKKQHQFRLDIYLVRFIFNSWRKWQTSMLQLLLKWTNYLGKRWPTSTKLMKWRSSFADSIKRLPW